MSQFIRGSQRAICWSLFPLSTQWVRKIKAFHSLSAMCALYLCLAKNHEVFYIVLSSNSRSSRMFLQCAIRRVVTAETRLQQRQTLADLGNS